MGQVLSHELEPVMVEHTRVCAFKTRELVCRKCNAERPKSHRTAVPRSNPRRWPACPSCASTERPIQRQGCLTCGKAKHDPDHYGHPPSFNADGSGDPQQYQDTKRRWSAILRPLLERSPLPTGCSKIVVEAVATFPDRLRRDQGNFRSVIEKALGDVLTEGGWLEDDQWYPVSRYEFGNLTAEYEKDVSRTRLILFPTLDTEQPTVAPADALFG